MQNYCRQQCQWLLLALQFFTRIPVRLILPYQETDLNRSCRYISVVGLIVAVIAVAAYWSGQSLYGPWGGALLAVTAAILTTGALHEDGLADAVDGFGGGQTSEQILLIMKDSRLGTYGAVATTLSLTAKIILLAQLSVSHAVIALCLQHMLSRTLAISLMLDLNYAQEDANSKVKPIAKEVHIEDMYFAAVIALLPCLILSAGEFLTLFAALWALRSSAVHYLVRRLGGYTGDCLGAVEQLAELLLLLILSAFWSQL